MASQQSRDAQRNDKGPPERRFDIAAVVQVLTELAKEIYGSGFISIQPYGAHAKDHATCDSDWDFTILYDVQRASTQDRGAHPSASLMLKQLASLLVQEAASARILSAASAPAADKLAINADAVEAKVPKIELVCGDVTIDVTVNNQLGLASVDFVKNLRKENRLLKSCSAPLIIFLKLLLSSKSLKASGLSHRRGLHSSAIELLVMGYLLDRSAWPMASRTRNTGMGQLLFELLTFYAQCFDPAQHKIVRGHGTVYFDVRYQGQSNGGYQGQSNGAYLPHPPLLIEALPEQMEIARTPDPGDWPQLWPQLQELFGEKAGNLKDAIRDLQKPASPQAASQLGCDLVPRSIYEHAQIGSSSSAGAPLDTSCESSRNAPRALSSSRPLVHAEEKKEEESNSGCAYRSLSGAQPSSVRYSTLGHSSFGMEVAGPSFSISCHPKVEQSSGPPSSIAPSYECPSLSVAQPSSMSSCPRSLASASFATEAPGPTHRPALSYKSSVGPSVAAMSAAEGGSNAPSLAIPPVPCYSSALPERSQKAPRRSLQAYSEAAEEEEEEEEETPHMFRSLKVPGAASECSWPPNGIW